MDWDLLALGHADTVATALSDASDRFDDENIPRHALFDSSSQISQTGQNNGPNGIAIGTTVATGLPGPDASQLKTGRIKRPMH